LPPFVCNGTFVMAPKRQPAHFEGIALDSFLGISLFSANCFNWTNGG